MSFFWKQISPSITCKRCMQTYRPRIHHICQLASDFECEICHLRFSQAIHLKVHKRLHSQDFRYACTTDNCNKKFISRNLLLKHTETHKTGANTSNTPNGESLRENVSDDVSLIIKDEENQQGSTQSGGTKRAEIANNVDADVESDTITRPVTSQIHNNDQITKRSAQKSTDSQDTVRCIPKSIPKTTSKFFCVPGYTCKNSCNCKHMHGCNNLKKPKLSWFRDEKTPPSSNNNATLCEGNTTGSTSPPTCSNSNQSNTSQVHVINCDCFEIKTEHDEDIITDHPLKITIKEFIFRDSDLETSESESSDIERCDPHYENGTVQMHDQETNISNKNQPVPVTSSLGEPSPSLNSDEPPFSTLASNNPNLNKKRSTTPSDVDVSVKRSKRTRRPTKFYGCSTNKDKLQVTGTTNNTESNGSSPNIRAGEISTSPSKTKNPVTSQKMLTTYSTQSETQNMSNLPPALWRNPDGATLQYFKTNNIRYPVRPPTGTRRPRPGETIYCYCRHPYDAKSDMIGCSGKGCFIEWFHNECVGVDVPPEGNWYCPECRSKYSK